MISLRKNFSNKYKDIATYLIEVWKENDVVDNIVFEYEQYWELSQEYNEIKDKSLKKELLGFYEELWKHETKQVWLDVMQVYADMNLYDIASRIMDKVNEFDIKQEYDLKELSQNEIEKGGEYEFDRETLDYIEILFRGREDMYTKEYIDANKNRKCEYIPEPLTKEIVKQHLNGKETVGTYIVRNNDTVHYVVFDVDISKKILMKMGQDKMDDYLYEAAEVANGITEVMGNMGLKSYIEFSGYRGFHVWLFFNEWIPVRYAYSLMEIVMEKVSGVGDSILVEMFPARNKKKNGSSGQTIKLPYGIHLYSGQRSYFLDNEFSKVKNCNDFFATIASYSIENIKRVIGANIADVMKNNVVANHMAIKIDESVAGEVGENVMTVLQGCNLMKYLVNKAVTTGYLSHFERLSILNVFGHVGEDGKDFVHKVMSFTLNYQYNTTQKFIDRLPGKPISCIKLREQYKQITA